MSPLEFTSSVYIRPFEVQPEGYNQVVARLLPLLINLGITIYALLDCARTPDEQVRSLPKWAWLLIIIVFEFIGGLAWLFAGRPIKQAFKPRPRKIIPPDDDPDFLRSI